MYISDIGFEMKAIDHVDRAELHIFDSVVVVTVDRSNDRTGCYTGCGPAV